MGGIVSKPKAPAPAPAPEPVAKPIQSTEEDRQKAARLRARGAAGRMLLSGPQAVQALMDPLSLKDTLGQ